MELVNVNRRSFLKMTGIATGGLILGWHVPKFAIAATLENPKALNAFLQITPDSQVMIYSPNPEIGQGVKTSMPMIVAEELDADWEMVTVRQAPIDPIFGRQSAGGSRSINTNWDNLRNAGGSAKHMLLQAAAEQWAVNANECRAKLGYIIHKPSGKKLSYGSLVERAANQNVPAPSDLTLKSFDEFTLLGKRIGGVDNLAIVTGQPLFGIDQHKEAMSYATFVKSPAYGAKPKKANLDEIKKLPGIKDAFIVKGAKTPRQLAHGIAIVATSTWAAFKAEKALVVEWDNSNAASDTYSEMKAQAEKLALKASSNQKLLNKGDAVTGLKNAAKTVSSVYSYPYIAHTPLEPMNCTAQWQDGKIEIWAPVQLPQPAIGLVSRITNVDPADITLHQTRVGGGFGRRLANDYVMEAVAIAQHVKGPVKYTSTRESDTGHDFYRPSAFFTFNGGVDEQGKITAWQEHFITMGGNKKANGPAGRRTTVFPAPLIDNFELSQSIIKSKMPIFALRAPQSNGLAFPIQSFLHELSTLAGRDHLEFLLEVLGESKWLDEGNKDSLHTGRAAEVLKLAAKKSGWGKKLEKGRGMGMAFYFCHSTPVAQVVDLSVDENKKITIHKVTIVGDAGPIVNLSGAENQCQGCVIDGLSVVMGQEITFTNGVVDQSNFHDYPLQRMPGVPEIESHFIQSNYPPTGLGEPAYPPFAPAFCNAIADATGVRLTHLPINKLGYSI